MAMSRNLPRLFIAACLILALPMAWFGYYAVSPMRSGAPEIVIEIHRSDTHASILKLLTGQGVIDAPGMFNWLGRITRQWRRVKAGEYKLSASMSPLQIFGTITSGISIIHPITVREGENMYEVADDVESRGLATKDEFVSLCKDRDFITLLGLDLHIKTLEGFLFPDTYHFNKTMTAEDMVRQMVRHANQMWSPQDQAAAEALGMDRYQVITLASIIEKETGAPDERPMISSVFHNRLKKHMKLQSDPTTIYGMWERFAGKIHRSDLQEANPYNTYSVNGLPAGPISNPGRLAITAALNPATSDYLFFVSHNDGTHQFSRSLAEHNLAVRKFQLDPKAREGKSWRDLSKRLAQPRQSN